jgi:hypothetical protein
VVGNSADRDLKRLHGRNESPIAHGHEPSPEVPESGTGREGGFWSGNGIQDPPAMNNSCLNPCLNGRIPPDNAANCRILPKWQDSILAFLFDPAVPFSNNLAEQDIRMLKVQQKISGCFRTLKGAQRFCRIRSYLSTARKQSRNIFNAIVSAMSGKPFIPSSSLSP